MIGPTVAFGLLIVLAYISVLFTRDALRRGRSPNENRLTMWLESHQVLGWIVAIGIIAVFSTLFDLR